MVYFNHNTIFETWITLLNFFINFNFEQKLNELVQIDNKIILLSNEKIYWVRNFFEYLNELY